jgi:predicted adenine nucleotide alpha hydrolase (AANH) superfamily ATPase
MKILLHVCCGPCTVYPLEILRQQGHEATGYFYNPNIHPYREFKQRIKALVEFAEQTNFTVTIDRNYGLTEYLRKVVFHENKRCSICYDMRLQAVAERAANERFEAFTTTLLYSKYQNHQLMKEKCESLARKYDIKFYYHDFREGWQQGIDASIAMNLYRQPYCGCIYSEQERYDKKMRNKK